MLRSAPFETPPAAAPQDKLARLEETHDTFAADIPAFPRFLETLRIDLHELLPAATPGRDHRLHAPADRFRKSRRSGWADANRGCLEIDSFLEGPSFDREGRLYVTDIPFGRVFRIDPGGEREQITEYDGWPNGLKIHRDGRIFIGRDPTRQEARPNSISLLS
jgi:hypothetical protein